MRQKTKTRRSIINEVAKENGITQAEAIQIIDSFFDKLSQSIKDGFRVNIRRFGTFIPFTKKASKHHNFHTGETIKKESRFWVKLKPSSLLLNKKIK